MKDVFIKYWSLLIIGSAIVIFCLATIMQNIFKIELKDSLSIIIAFISIFATFGGAYIGAKVSGENAIKINQNSIENEHRKNSFPLKMEIVNYIEDIQENTTRKLELKRFNGKKIHTGIKKDNPDLFPDELNEFFKYFYDNKESIINKLNEFYINKNMYSLKESNDGFYDYLNEYKFLMYKFKYIWINVEIRPHMNFKVTKNMYNMEVKKFMKITQEIINYKL